MPNGNLPIRWPTVVATAATGALPILIAVFAAWLDLRGDVGELKGRLAGFDQSVEQFNTVLYKTLFLPPNVEKLRGQVDRFESLLSELQNQHQALETRLGEIEEIVAPPGSEPIPTGFFPRVMNRVSRIEQQLDSVATKLGAGRVP